MGHQIPDGRISHTPAPATKKLSMPLVLQLVQQSVCWNIGWHTD